MEPNSKKENLLGVAVFGGVFLLFGIISLMLPNLGGEE
jgi:hypothetical protein